MLGDTTDEMLVPPKPPPPCVGKVTHHSIELYWADALARLNEIIKKGDRRVRVVVQEMEKSQSWGTVYIGYSKHHVVEGLEPLSKYTYRIRFKNDFGDSEWSPVQHVATTKEPLTSEHLHGAVNRRDLMEVSRILETGDVNVDVPDKFGFTTLMQAAQKGYLDVAHLLVNKGATVNEQNENYKTALMLACFSGKYDIVEFLRQCGASYDQRDKSGCQAVHYATDGAHLELLRWIIDDGAQVNARDNTSGWTPLIRCAAVGGNSDVAQILIQKGADVNAMDKDGKTALMVAVVNGHQGLVEILLDNHADFTIRSEYGKTAYDMAVSLEKVRVQKTLEAHMQGMGLDVSRISPGRL